MKAELTKKITLEEFAYGLQVLLEKSDHIGTAGVLIPKTAKKLKEDQKEAEKFYQKARRHGFVKCSADGNVYLERNIDTILKSIHKSRFCVMMQKASWKDNEKLISVYWTNGCYIAAYQEQSHNQVTIFLDHSPENLYQVIEEYLLKKDGKFGWKKKKINEFLKKEEFESSEITPTVRLQCTFMDSWKRQVHSQENLLLNEEQLEQYTTDGSHLWQEKGNATELKQRILAIWKRLEHDWEEPNEELEENEKKSKLQETKVRTESKWNYDSLLEMKGFPTSYLGYIKWIIVNLFSSGKQMAKSASVKTLFKRILITVMSPFLFGVLVTFWNMYATCYLNDTYFFERRSMWGNLTPYFLAGSLRTPSDIKGFQLDWGNITTEYIVLPLSVFAFLLLRGIIIRIRKKGIQVLAKDIIGIIPLVVHCKKICQKSLMGFIQKGLFYACIFGFLLFNPFAVALLIPIFLLSFAQGEESAMALTIMSWRTAGSVKKVEQGKVKPLTYEEVLLDIFGFAMGFLIYSIFNWIMWTFFDYHYHLRLVMSILLLISTLIQINPKAKNPKQKNADQKKTDSQNTSKMKKQKTSDTKQEKMKKIQSIVVYAVCFLVAVTVVSLVLKAGIAFADDGGWTESGGTLKGLIANAGFGLIMGISVLVGLATFGVGLGVAAGIAAITAGAATIFASTTEYGHRTAEQIVYGRYSDSDPTLLGTALQIGIDLVPVWGKIYGLGAGARDISYDIQNWEGTTQDYINLGIDVFGFTMNGIGLKTDLDNLSHASKLDDVANGTNKNFVDDAFDDSGNLKPNSRYKTGEYDYYYETDDMGRISSFEADDLRHTNRTERLPHNSKSLGKQKGDDAGHLIADRFGGSSDLDNIVSQASGINRSDYKIIENSWADAIGQGKKVSVKGNLVYEGTSLRPSGFQLEWTIDGEYFSDFLPNFK